MNFDAFKNLELLPELLKEVSLISERMAKFAPPITSKKEVAKFIGRSESTINNYINRGLLKEGYHFNRKNGKILVFIEEAIVEFRNELSRGIANEKVTF